jgi:hypothetical protein
MMVLCDAVTVMCDAVTVCDRDCRSFASSLSLFENDLTGTIPESLGSLTGLQ